MRGLTSVIPQVNGEWVGTQKYEDVVDPLNGEKFIQMPDTQISELGPFIESMSKCPKSGLHNPYKHPERYVMYGEVSAK